MTSATVGFLRQYISVIPQHNYLASRAITTLKAMLNHENLTDTNRVLKRKPKPVIDWFFSFGNLKTAFLPVRLATSDIPANFGVYFCCIANM